MAPVSSTDASSAPLADYFFICGIESTQVFDERSPPIVLTSPLASPPVDVDETIEEDRALETDSISEGLSNGEGTKRKSARLSFDHRNSVSTIIGPDSRLSASNRSSATIKGLQIGGSGLSDVEFESALRKFASERDTFLEDMQFTAGVAQQNRPTRPPRPKPQRVQHEDVSNLRSGVGSIRRRLSTMSSLKRQPSMARQASVRTSKRLSGYNSVIPTPQPFNSDPNMHPLLRRYEPVLMDRYPPKNMVDELKRRNPFPDYVPMFAFPNDVNVVSSDERPKTTWHGFAMTNGDNSKLYGICMIVWTPLNAAASEGLERQCEEWRRIHMNPEERELASSLGERLAQERVKLSRLLDKLSNMGQVDSDDREDLVEEISAVEEKIGLMTDLLRPVRHGAASKIEGLTDGETGLWIPRAYGVMGRDANLTPFWKEWLKAVVVPMTDGLVRRVPATSPRVGMWQPLERYVVNLCAEALSPITSITQVEMTVRDLRLYARKEAVNELPGSRNIDLYALFRSLSIPNIVTLFEYVLQESRIILLSSHTAMLHLASAALVNLLYPFKWAGVFIPILPARLIQTIEAPCPYIVGIERRYEPAEYPEDDYVLVDLDNDMIGTNGDAPVQLPRQQRRKLMSLLQHSAPHHTRYGVPVGPPQYAIETYPHDTFCSENPGVFTHRAHPSTLATYAGMNSTSFGSMVGAPNSRPIIYNAFLQSSAHSRGNDRPSTASTIKTASNSPPSPKISPISQVFPPLPSTPISRSDSGYALQANLREKRSGHFETSSRRSSSVSSPRFSSLPQQFRINRFPQFGFDRVPTVRRPSQPFLGHAPSMSTSSLSNEIHATSSYAPSVYAQSTLAASTIMPGMAMQPVRNTETTRWQEGHCLQWKGYDEQAACSICNDKSDEGTYRCSGCNTFAHGRCVGDICVVCPTAFRPDQVRASFVRCFASLLYTYRRYMLPATGDQKKSGMVYRFKMDEFLKSMPHENAQYMSMLQQTQGLNEFIHERESTRADDPSIKLFDEIILAKRNRGRSSFFHKQRVDFLADTTDHLWRTAAATPPNSRFPGDYRSVTTRIPPKLDPNFMKEPRVIQGVPRIPLAKARRKPIPSMLGPHSGISS